MKQKFFSRPVYLRLAAAALLSLVYGILQPPFLLHVIDGLSILSVLFLFAGILIYWWKEGFFSFFTWKKQEGSFLTYRETLRNERAQTENPTFYAGLILFVLSLVLTGLYTLLQ